MLSACSENTLLDSDTYDTPEERVEVLGKVIQTFSPIKDAEFELFNVNGFNDSDGLSIAGASYSNFKFAVKVDTADIHKWRDGMIKFDPPQHYNKTWIKDIVKNAGENWQTTTAPTYYHRTNLPEGWSTTVVEFYAEGIVFKQVVMN